jgi:hypothetical protein
VSSVIYPSFHVCRSTFRTSKLRTSLAIEQSIQNRFKGSVMSLTANITDNLCRKKVTIDGREMPYRYFSQDTDIAFATCLDGYLLYKRKRGGPSATPILIKLYNLPPEVRIHMHRLLCLGAIPGPKSPKRPETFLYPLDQERVDLAIGVKTFDCRTKAYFDLRAYNLFTLGDIIAIEKFLNLKGHNGKCPCRSCQITAVATINKGTPTMFP